MAVIGLLCPDVCDQYDSELGHGWVFQFLLAVFVGCSVIWVLKSVVMFVDRSVLHNMESGGVDVSLACSWTVRGNWIAQSKLIGT